MIVAAIAKKFGKFEKSVIMLKKCRALLLSILKSPDDCFRFAKEYAGTELAMMLLNSWLG